MLKNTLISFICMFCCLCLFQNLAAHVEAVVFDCHGVFFQTVRQDEFRQEVYEKLSKILDIPIKEVLERIRITREIVSLNEDDRRFWMLLFAESGQNLPEDWYEDLTDLRVSYCHEIEGTIDIVKSLKMQKLKIAMLSNAYPFHRDMVKKLGYYDLFPTVILSCEIGNIEKPDPRAYHVLLTKLDLRADQCVFIDDKEENIIAAQALGIDAILFQSVKQLQEELANRHILPDAS